MMIVKMKFANFVIILVNLAIIKLNFIVQAVVKKTLEHIILMTKHVLALYVIGINEMCQLASHAIKHGFLVLIVIH